MRRGFLLGIFSRSGLVILLGLLLGLAAPAAMAQTLDELRASGALGERYDGYVAVRDGNAAGAQKVAKEVNTKRQSLYEQRAAAQGVKPEDIGRVYAEQIMQKAPGGTWFLDENGNWRQK